LSISLFLFDFIMVSGVARGLLGVAGWTRDKSRLAGDLMDFASEPVLDAFTPPPTRAAPRAPVADDNGQTFGDHLDAVNEPATERPAPAQQNEAKDETPRVEANASTGEDTSNHDETIDPEVALLGGPLPPAPPPMAAPVAVQIVASQEPQQTQAQPEDGDFNVAPANAPQAPSPVEPAQEAATAQPADQSAPSAGKTDGGADVPAQQQAQQSAPQTQSAQTQVAVPQIPVVQTAPTTAEVLPEVLQQAIAATTAPAPQATAQPTTAPRASKDAKQPAEATAASVDGEAKSDANTNVKAPAPKASSEGAIKVDAAPTLQTQSSAPDTSQLAQSNTIAATTSQTSTHVQHAAADIGAQRAAPVAAQVGREIVRRFSGGNTNFELRLDPADLGRVEVRMEVTRDNRVTAVITADNPQALTELARSARELEQQLQSAGLQLSDNGLSFDLRQGAQGGESDDQRNSDARGESNAAAAPQEQQAAPLARPIGIDRWRGVRVDMMV
jgi:flagellar hook-length control protein FliK